MMIMPCFHRDQAFAEGVILGHLFTGYGELELEMCRCLIVADKGQLDKSTREVFGKRGAELRIKLAAKRLQPIYEPAGLGMAINEALQDLDWCREIRNQYAHCYWGWTPDRGLFFANLEELAKDPAPIAEVLGKTRSIDVALLQEQERFFVYVKETFYALSSEYLAWVSKKEFPRRTPYSYARPSKVPRPPLFK